MSTEIDEICRKLRATVREYGQDKMKMGKVVIITTLDCKNIGGHNCVRVPTIGQTTLGNCSFGIARFFEDA